MSKQEEFLMELKHLLKRYDAYIDDESDGECVRYKFTNGLPENNTDCIDISIRNAQVLIQGYI